MFTSTLFSLRSNINMSSLLGCLPGPYSSNKCKEGFPCLRELVLVLLWADAAALGLYLDYTQQTFPFTLSEFWPSPDSADLLLVRVRQAGHLGRPQEPGAMHTYSSGSDSKCWQSLSYL